eukprot:COSAG01_NODE_4079_length_5376_cov_433.496494_6_plen_45_part_00
MPASADWSKIKIYDLVLLSGVVSFGGCADWSKIKIYDLVLLGII